MTGSPDANVDPMDSGPGRVEAGAAPSMQADLAPLPALPAAGAWRRLLARLFDMWWEVPSIAFGGTLLLGALSDGFAQWVGTAAGAQWFGVICLPLGFLADAVLLAKFGVTPGKALLGVRVETLAGQPLGLRAAVLRTLGVWVAGLALTIPLLNLVTLGRQGWRVGKGRPASYDEGRYRVLARPLGWGRRLGFVAAGCGLFVLLGLLNQGERPARPAQVATPSPATSWTNPENGRRTTVGPGWSHDILYDDDGKPTYRFVSDNGRAAVLFSSEPIGPTPLDVYARTVAESAAENLKLDGRFEDFLGSQSWAAENFLDNDAVTRVEVRVLRHDGHYWSVIGLQDYPYRDTDAAIHALRQQLWATVAPPAR